MPHTAVGASTKYICEICGGITFTIHDVPYIVCEDCRHKAIGKFMEQIVENYYASHKQEAEQTKEATEAGIRIPTHARTTNAREKDQVLSETLV